MASICDVPGCGHTRRRCQRLCGRCYGRLPGEIRVGITEAHHQRRYADYTALRKRAAEYLGLTGIVRGTVERAGRPAPSPTAVYAANARLLGERE